MTVSASIKMQLTVRETLSDADAASSPIVTHDNFNLSETLNASSTVPASKTAPKEIALSSGAATIDLSALDGTEGTVDGTGLKLQAIMLENKTGNADMTFSKGASNGYELGGDASWQITLKQGQRVLFFLNEQEADIASGAKTIDVSGTGTEAFKLHLVMG